ncbi:MAG: Ger(x)C family spore germination protein [Bacillota bacterium]
MWRRALAGLLVVGTLLPLAGCWDAASPEHIAWVSAIGVDAGGEGNFVFTFQTIVPRAVTSGGGGGLGGGGGGGGGQGHSFVVYSVEAPDVITAIEMSDAFVARRVNLLHTKVLILGEEVVERGVTPLLAPAIRYREFRRTLHVLVSRGAARDFLRLAQPRLETDPGLWYEVMLTWQRETQLVPPTRIHEFVIAIEEPGLGARAALVAPREDVAAKEEEIAERASEGRFGSPAAVLAGDVSRLGEMPVEFMGTAVFKRDRLAGFLTGQETRAVALLRGELSRRTPISIPDPTEPEQRVVLIIQNQAAPEIRTRLTDDGVHVDFVVRVEGDIGSIPSATDYAEANYITLLEEAAEKYIGLVVEDVLETSLQEWGTDLYRLGERLRAAFPTTSAWAAFDWASRVKDTTFTVEIQFKVRRHGLQTEPSRPGR